MSRPTNERKDKTVKFRISEDMYKELESRGDNLSETIREILKENVPQKKQDIESNVPQNKKNDTYEDNPLVSDETRRDIESMCIFFGMSTEEYFKRVCELMNDGYIRGDNGEIKTYDSDGIEMERFKDACHTANRDVQEMIDKCAQLIEKGRI